MLVLLSPAKKLHDAPAASPLPTTVSPLMKETEMLLRTTRRLSAKKLKELMHISDELAALNRHRFQVFETPLTDENSTPAALTFAGDTYIGFDAGTMSPEDLAFAQAHVGILSGLYGLLKPLDLMQPYRLEMGTRLKTRRGESLYAFWGDRITKHLNQRLAEQDEPTLVNLASNEYFRSVKPKGLKARVITPAFKEIKPDGSMKTVSFVAKRARGMMARFVVDQRLTEPSGLKAFNRAHYQFTPSLSDETTWTFTRPWQDKPLAGMP